MQPILDIIAYIQYNNPIGTMAGYLRLAFVIVVPIFVFIKTSYKKGFLFSLLPIALLGLLHCANSVSYTHLDVYKRQVIVTSTEKEKELRDVGVNAINLMYTDYEGFQKSTTILGQILGGEYEERAKALVDYTQWVTDTPVSYTHLDV